MIIQLQGYKRPQEVTLIVWLKGCGNYTYVYLAGVARPLLISVTLKYFEALLAQFLRVNKSSLVNPLYVDKVVMESVRAVHLLLKNGTSISVSRRRIPETIALLGDISTDRIAKHQNGSPIEETSTAKDYSLFGDPYP